MSLVREPNAEPIPGYRLIEPLGSGGFGEAWKCEAPGGLFKAIKFVYGNLNSLDMDSARAEQERNALERIKQVRHPFILSMDRIDILNGELIIVMDLADSSLHECYEECLSQGLRGIPRDQLWGYIRDAAEALDHMNETYHLQHLDIKPRNLFLVSNRVKVADFGLVKNLERSGAHSMLGGVTPLYAPPETFAGTISQHSDQYSLAIVYTELLTGQRPFDGKTPRRLAEQHVNDEPELRMLPEGDRLVVARALAKDPAKRFPSCLAFVRALHNARAPARPEVIQPELAQNGTRHKTTSDTMEDLLLEQIPLDAGNLVDVDPAASPLQELSAEEVSQLGLTMALPQTGALRPTVVIGLGSMGRRALMELRCRFIDRFGDLEKVPLFRFLYIDTDADALKQTQRAAPEMAFKNHEIYQLPLQPVAHYRRRQLDQLNDWLPREKLYAMPRSLKTQGSRALGRLAFSDNYQRLMARLRRELQQAMHPDSLYQTVSQTGLALRDSIPRVYVIACASGGASGYLTDLGYAIGRLFQVLRQPDATATSLLFCGAPDDPATPAAELANIYATLTELNHFADPAIPFTAQYGAEGPRLTAEGPAYDSTYLLPFSHRTPESRRNTLAHLSSYLFHELTTPLGMRLEKVRKNGSPTEGLPFRSLGTYGVWFPRGLLLRLSAQRACRDILDRWQESGEPTAGAELEAAQARLLADPDLLPETLLARISQGATPHLEAPPADVLMKMLTALEEQSAQAVAQDDPATWAHQSVGRVQEWLGNGLPTPVGSGVTPNPDRGHALSVTQRKSKLTRALEQSANALAEEWERRFLEAAARLVEHPGRRVAAAEALLRRLGKYCTDAAAVFSARWQQKQAQTQAAQVHLQTALENCLGGAGGFSWFGGRSRRTLRVFMDHLAAFARQCLADDVAGAVLQFYCLLKARLDDRQRDLTFCRQQLRHLQEALETTGPTFLEEAHDPASAIDLSPSPTPALSTESFWESIRESATARVVLPDGLEDLEQAAREFLSMLSEEQWVQLDQALQDQVLSQWGGLLKVCLGNNDLTRYLTPALLNQAIAVLGTLLPITDVTEVEVGLSGPNESEMSSRIQGYHEQAAPLLGQSAATTAIAPAGQSKGPGPQCRVAELHHSFLLVPGSEAGKTYAVEAQKTLEDIHIVNVPGQADLMFCREVDSLRLEDVERILQVCRRPYEEANALQVASPHARFDIQDWSPLDP